MLALPVFYFAGLAAGLLVLVLLAFIDWKIYHLSDRILLKWYHCEAMPLAEYANVHSMLYTFSDKVSIRLPKPFIFESMVPVIFSVGSDDASKIVMSRGLLELLNKRELEAIIAREIARISEGDVAQNTFISMMAGIIASLSTAALWMSMLGGFGQEGDPAPRFIRFVAMGLVMLPAALLVYLGVSDQVLSSDAKATSILGQKDNLASALKRIDTEIRLHSVEYFNPGHAQLFVVNPVKVNSLYDIHLSLFVAKPDMTQRLMALSSSGNVN
ncbi:M48 family metalloprotease [Methanolobus sp. ZRKC3]|uniref:M48 family metalloprotease n=1 Tax=Methanolobus sp. ZRKC3 TaxID=3125786 RepID=UPI003248F123